MCNLEAPSSILHRFYGPISSIVNVAHEIHSLHTEFWLNLYFLRPVSSGARYSAIILIGPFRPARSHQDALQTSMAMHSLDPSWSDDSNKWNDSSGNWTFKTCLHNSTIHCDRLEDAFLCYLRPVLRNRFTLQAAKSYCIKRSPVLISSRTLKFQYRGRTVCALIAVAATTLQRMSVK